MMEESQMEEMMVAVLRHYGFREPGWGERSIRCPVHDETHPSASINRQKGLFNCHACGASGNAANIVMMREGLDFKGALEFIEELGVNVKSRPPLGRAPQRGRGHRWVPPSLRGTA